MSTELKHPVVVDNLSSCKYMATTSESIDLPAEHVQIESNNAERHFFFHNARCTGELATVGSAHRSSALHILLQQLCKMTILLN
jgi:hypothetical protein